MIRTGILRIHTLQQRSDTGMLLVRGVINVVSPKHEGFTQRYPIFGLDYGYNFSEGDVCVSFFEVAFSTGDEAQCLHEGDFVVFGGVKFQRGGSTGNRGQFVSEPFLLGSVDLVQINVVALHKVTNAVTAVLKSKGEELAFLG